MSKADKLRDKLASMQKDRAEFERQKKELEEQMNIGRQNMGKIQKGLKNNLIINDPIVLETTQPIQQLAETVSNSIAASQNVLKPRVSKTNVKSGQGTGGNTPAPPPSTDSPSLAPNIIIPTGARISDWCFVGAMDTPPPTVKSRDLYENVRLLGRGSFGEVNLVKNVDDNRLFAIKTIFCSRDGDMDLVMREIRFLRINRHPYVIDVYDAFVTSNPRVVHIVMHYCESGTLASVISSAKKTKTSLSETQIVKWVVQLALAMHFLHSNHTLHRDLKPMNVMLTEGGDLLKLADFGLALDMDNSSHKQLFDEAGTPYYTAPEMIQRESYSYPADCWSFGVILHQLMALERPFEGSSTADLVKAVLSSEPPTLPAHYSEELRNISRELLRKNQSERLSMAGLLCEPSIFTKLSNFPSTYRPRYLEERIRRSHTKQLEQQLDALQRHRKSSVSSMIRAKSESVQSTTSSFSVGSSDFPDNPSPQGKIGGDGDTSFANMAPLLEDIAEQLGDHNRGSVAEKTSRGNSTKTLGAPPPMVIGNSGSKLGPSISDKSLGTPGSPQVPPDGSKQLAQIREATPVTLSSSPNTSSKINIEVSLLAPSLAEAAAAAAVEEPPEDPLMHHSLSRILADAPASAGAVDQSKVEEILNLGDALAPASTLPPSPEPMSISIGTSPAVGGRKGAELVRAIQQDQEIERSQDVTQTP